MDGWARGTVQGAVGRSRPSQAQGLGCGSRLIPLSTNTGATISWCCSGASQSPSERPPPSQGPRGSSLACPDRRAPPTDPSPLPSTPNNYHAIIGGIVAFVVFLMLILLIFLGHYLIRHKGGSPGTGQHMRAREARLDRPAPPAGRLPLTLTPTELQHPLTPLVLPELTAAGLSSLLC